MHAIIYSIISARNLQWSVYLVDRVSIERLFSCSHCSESSKVNELQLEFDENDRTGGKF